MEETDTENRTAAVRIRVRPSEKKAYDVVAKRADMSVSDWARRILNAAASDVLEDDEVELVKRKKK